MSTLKWTGDPGTTDIGANIEIRFVVKHEDRPYRLTISTDHSCGLDTVNPDTGIWHAVDMNTGIARHIMGYAFRRILCRGVDRVEICEGDAGIAIDFGKFKIPTRLL